MAQQRLYKNVAPVSSQRHGDLCVDHSNYGYAAGVNAVPVMTAEMTAAAPEYSIVFAGEDAITPVAVLGLERNKNQFVDADGAWNARFLPAYVRRYPFVFSEHNDQFILCIDEDWSGCNREGRGERLFDDQGQRTEFLDRTLKLLEDSQAQVQHTQSYCQRLKDFDLLDPMQANVTLPNGEQRSLGGFMAVSRDKLKELAPEKLAELARSDELELTYIHLHSLRNFVNLPQEPEVQPA